MRFTVRRRHSVKCATISLIDQPPATSGCVMLASPISSSNACQSAFSCFNSLTSWALLRVIPVFLSFHPDSMQNIASKQAPSYQFPVYQKKWQKYARFSWNLAGDEDLLSEEVWKIENLDT